MLKFTTKGQGRPVLIVHGWTMASFVEAYDFEPAFQNIAGYKRIYVDLPGTGDTPSDGIQNLDDIYDRLRAFVQEHILPDRFLLIGTSCGALSAEALAYDFHQHIWGLLLRVPLVEPSDARRDIAGIAPAIEDKILIASLSDEDRKQVEEFSIPVHTKAYIDRYKTKLEAAALPSIAKADNTVLDSIRNDPTRYCLTKAFHSLVEPFPSPTLIITGKQDTVVGYRDAWRLLERYPRATFVALDRADHGYPIDEQGLFKALVGDWLRRCEESERR